jgi:D-sedoheptulose 7-phosphate isomerase
MNTQTATSLDIVRAQLIEHAETIERLHELAPLISDLAGRIIKCLEAGGKVLFFGNGGSAADAQHLAAEFVVRFRLNRKALPAIALTTDTSILTACGNDFGFDTIYARQIEALANKEDVVIGISTSGNSPNVIAALSAAKSKGSLTVTFTGQKSNKCSDIADLAFQAPSSVTARIQECHLLAGHIICELIDEHFAGK